MWICEPFMLSGSQDIGVQRSSRWCQMMARGAILKPCEPHVSRGVVGHKMEIKIFRWRAREAMTTTRCFRLGCCQQEHLYVAKISTSIMGGMIRSKPKSKPWSSTSLQHERKVIEHSLCVWMFASKWQTQKWLLMLRPRMPARSNSAPPKSWLIRLTPE